MEFFLDTAEVSEIEKGMALGLVDGVTTNPSLLAKAGGDWREVARTICKLVSGPVSLEVIADDSGEMVEQARELIKFGPNVVIKIPMTMEGLLATKKLHAMDIQTNMTLVFSVNQALLAAKAGADFVSPFVGRLDDQGQDGLLLVEEIMQVFANYGLLTKVIVASIRSPAHVKGAALLGADVATIPYGVLVQLSTHPLTDQGLEKFAQDWAKCTTTGSCL